jgi:hypothetical protein
MCGASNGYMAHIWVRIARCTDDLTLDLEPGATLRFGLDGVVVSRKGRKETRMERCGAPLDRKTYSFLNILALTGRATANL